jgi:hypothetical protein
LASLNHLTVPCSIVLFVPLKQCTAERNLGLFASRAVLPEQRKKTNSIRRPRIVYHSNAPVADDPNFVGVRMHRVCAEKCFLRRQRSGAGREQRESIHC